MPEMVLYSGKAPKILLLEKNQEVLDSFLKAAGPEEYRLIPCSSQRELLDLIQKKLFRVLLINPDLAKESFPQLIQSIRQVRGYEKMPVVVIPDKERQHEISDFLDAGADGYMLAPFRTENVRSHLNLFLRKSLYQKLQEDQTLRKGFDNEKGSILICTNSKTITELPVKSIETEIIPVLNEEELFKNLDQKNIWLVLIGLGGEWALPLVGRIKSLDSGLLQVLLLRNGNTLDNAVVDFFNNGGDDVVNIKKPAFILARQFNSRIERELYYKNKYLTALRSAAMKLPIRSEKELLIQTENWRIEAAHHAFESIPGGDLYEVIRLENGNHMVILGDVMGKKWGAWFFSLAYLAYIRSTLRFLSAREDINPATLLTELNKSLYQDFKLSEVFTTLTVVLLHKSGNEAELASAAGLPLLHKKEHSLDILRPEGQLLGFLENAKYELYKVQLLPEESLILFTDGYLEEPASTGESIIENFAGTVRETASAECRAHLLEKAYSEKHGGYSDDRTLLTLTYSGNT